MQGCQGCGESDSDHQSASQRSRSESARHPPSHLRLYPAQASILCPRVALQQIYDSSKFSLLADGSEVGKGGTQLVMQLRAETDEERHAQMWVQAFGSEWATDDDDDNDV